MGDILSKKSSFVKLAYGFYILLIQTRIFLQINAYLSYFEKAFPFIILYPAIEIYFEFIPLF